MPLVQVFLSSTTKDLASCREAAYAAIHRLEGYHCVRMEDAGATDRPPLSWCLKKVAESDVYVGILGHLYGSCPEGGEKSYTELEYEKATELGKPRLIFLASNEFPIRPDHIEDAERQQRQKQFRFRIGKDLLRQEFSTPEDLALTVAAAIHNWGREELTALQEKSKEAQAPVGGGTEPVVPATLDSITANGDESSAQRINAVKALMKSLAAGKFELVDAASESPSAFDVARLFLSTKALFAERCSRESLTPHEVNYLYLHRETLRFCSGEAGLLWGALLGEHAGIIPGWYWFGSMMPKNAEEMLWSSALANSSETVRKNALSLLQEARVGTGRSGFERKDLIEVILRDSPDVQTAFFNYLQNVGDGADVALIGAAIEDERLSARDAAANAKWHIRARVEPEGAFGDVLQMPEPPGAVVSAIGAAVPHVSDGALLGGITCKAKSLRLASVSELARRGKLPHEVARTLLGDESLLVRAACYSFLLSQGEPFEAVDIRRELTPPETKKPAYWYGGFLTEERVDVDEVIRKAIENRPFDELFRAARWPELDGPIAYQVLAERHFGRLAPMIREDLRSKFARLREGWVVDRVDTVVAELRAAASPIGDEQQMRERIRTSILGRAGDRSELDDWIYRRFAGSAIAGLVQHGEPADVAFGRELLANRKKDSFYGDAEAQAVCLIARFGDVSDVEALVAVAREAYGETKELAAKTALRLSPGTEGVAKQFAEVKDTTLFRLMLESLQESAPTDTRAFAETYLGDGENFKRIAALRSLVKVAKPEELESILSTYVSKTPYYYNVVCWLDRVLFSPTPFREAYIGELERA